MELMACCLSSVMKLSHLQLTLNHYVIPIERSCLYLSRIPQHCQTTRNVKIQNKAASTITKMLWWSVHQCERVTQKDWLAVVS